MLQKAFFKVDVVDRIYDTPVFVKTTPGAYEFTVPEYAGAGGGDGYGAEGTLVAKGRGGVLKIQKTKIKNFTINGIVASVGGAPNGGTGYNNGQNGTVVEGCSGGGGGGCDHESVRPQPERPAEGFERQGNGGLREF